MRRKLKEDALGLVGIGGVVGTSIIMVCHNSEPMGARSITHKILEHRKILEPFQRIKAVVK